MLEIIILLLSIIICILALALIFVIKLLPKYLISNKEKDFLLFTIDMYIEYSKDLNIHSEEQHDIIIKELNKLKEKYFKK